jgi:hypothetical protein
MGPGEQAIDANRNRRRAMSTAPAFRLTRDVRGTEMTSADMRSSLMR